MIVLDLFLHRLIRQGTLTLIDETGRIRRFGSGEPRVTARIHDRRTGLKLFLNPEYELGEAYMNGTLTVEEGDIYDLVDLAMRNSRWNVVGPLAPLQYRGRKLGRRLAQFNLKKASRRNVAHHYDLKDELFDLFLDTDRQYSCAYFPDLDMSIEEAQAHKKRHLA